MQTKEKLVEQLDWLTDKISSQVWTLNLGTLATTWSLLIASGSVEKLRIGPAKHVARKERHHDERIGLPELSTVKVNQPR